MEQSPQDNSVGVFTLDANLEVQVWDAELERASGLAAKEARGKSILALFPDLETRGLVKHFHRVLKDSIVVVLAPAFHHYLIPCAPRQPSQRFDKMQQRVTIAPLRQGDRTLGIIVSLEDVTARIDRERDLAEQLAHADDAKRLEAVQILREDPEIESAAPLLDALHDQSWLVRRAAVEGFSRRAAPDAIAALLESVREDHYNVSLLNSALQVLTLSDVDTLSPLIEFLQGEDPDLRMQAALALGEQRDSRAIQPLIAAVEDPEANVRYHAIEALGKLRAAEAAELLTAIAEERDFFLSFVALEALGQLGDASVTSRIVPLLDDELLREPAATVLGKLGDEHTVAPLTALLNAGGGPTAVIARALATLYQSYEKRYGEGGHIADLTRQFTDANGKRSLVNGLYEHNIEELRSLAVVTGWLDGPTIAQALTSLLSKPELRPEVLEALVRHGKGVTKLLIEQLTADDFETRKSAVIALGRIGDKSATPALMEILHQDEQLLIAATDSLARIGDPQAFAALLELIGHESAAVRQAVVGALNSLGAPEAPTKVIPLLDDSNPRVRESAVKIAGYFGYPKAFEKLLERCHDDDETVRRAAVEHLPFFEDRRGFDEITGALRKDTAKVRAAAAGSLGHIDRAFAVPVLLETVKDTDPWVRYFGARSLGRHRAAESTEALAEIVQFDEFKHVRIAALDSLGKIGGSRAAAVAAAVAVGDDPEMAAAALEALGQMDLREALEPLVGSTRSPEISVRVAAVKALGQRGGDVVVEHLARAVMDSERAVFENAIDMLGKVGTADAIAALIGFVADPLRRERVIAVLALSGDKVDQVAGGLSNPRIEVREGIVEALGRMKSARASEWVKTALDDPSGSVRAAAASALGISLKPGVPTAGAEQFSAAPESYGDPSVES
jgi:HEAT repeat protein